MISDCACSSNPQHDNLPKRGKRLKECWQRMTRLSNCVQFVILCYMQSITSVKQLLLQLLLRIEPTACHRLLTARMTTIQAMSCWRILRMRIKRPACLFARNPALQQRNFNRRRRLHAFFSMSCDKLERNCEPLRAIAQAEQSRYGVGEGGIEITRTSLFFEGQ